jgi:CheY-like chemotaxis protein
VSARAIEPGTKAAPVEDPTTILVVEDDEPIRLAIRELLEAEGYDVIAAVDGAEALVALESATPSLVVTDLQMPNVDGEELCIRLRGDDRTAEIPIVVLTAAHRTDAVDGRADAIIRKPFDIDALLGTIAQFIRPTLPPRPMTTAPSVRLTLGPQRATFVLYVTAGTASSSRAERTVTAVAGARRIQIEVVDVLVDEARAERDGIAMTPTLVRTAGGTREVFVGDLSESALIEEFLDS